MHHLETDEEIPINKPLFEMNTFSAETVSVSFKIVFIICVPAGVNQAFEALGQIEVIVVF